MSNKKSVTYTSEIRSALRKEYYRQIKEYGFYTKKEQPAKPVVSTSPRKPRYDIGKARQKYQTKLHSKMHSYINRANAKAIEFTLTEEEFLNMCKEPCHYCMQVGGGIDRKDSRRGYTVSNSVPCCGICNWMKREHSYNMFVEHCCKVASVYNKRQWD